LPKYAGSSSGCRSRPRPLITSRSKLRARKSVRKKVAGSSSVIAANAAEPE
jgi:hypothetical protein